MNQINEENWKREYKGEVISAHKSQISPLQKKEETVSHALMKRALKIESLLKELLDFGNNAIDGVYLTKMREGKYAGKTTFEFSSFDGTVVIKKDMRRKYRVYPDKLKEASAALIEWANSAVVHDTVKDRINEIAELPEDRLEITTTAIFEVFQLNTVYKDKSLADALELLREAIAEETSDPYFRVYVEDENKELRLINTSLSKV